MRHRAPGDGIHVEKDYRAEEQASTRHQLRVTHRDTTWGAKMARYVALRKWREKKGNVATQRRR